MWVKQGKNGPYFGIKIDNQRAYNTGTPGVPRPTPRDNPMQRVKSAPSTQRQARAHDDLDEDVPFAWALIFAPASALALSLGVLFA
jgi:hypothetical protein